MIVLDVEQGSPEWIAARLGIPTASQFSRLMTAKTMKLSAGSATYMNELVAERMLNASLDPYVSELMERGSGMEQQAVDYYELQRDVETETVGHVLTDDRKVGCSPDRLVGTDGGLEIKCPTPQVHVGYMLGDEGKYKAQIQGCMWVCERKWWDWLSFHPELPPVLVRFHRDEEFISKLGTAVNTFVERMDYAMERVKAMDK